MYDELKGDDRGGAEVGEDVAIGEEDGGVELEDELAENRRDDRADEETDDVENRPGVHKEVRTERYCCIKPLVVTVWEQ